MLYIRFQAVKRRKKDKNTVDDLKKGYQKFSALKWKAFPKRRSFKNISVPSNSAPNLRLWYFGTISITRLSLMANL